MIQQAKEFAWSTPLRKWITLVVTIGAIGGAIKTTAEAWPLVRPVTPVLHYQFQRVIDKQAVAMDRFLLWQQQEALEKVRRDPAAATSPTVQETIRSLDQQVRATEERLRRARANE